MCRKVIILASGLTCLLFMASNAMAQGDAARQQAQQQFQRGMELVQQERWEEALTSFDESLRSYPTQTALFNRALCLGLLARPAEAVAALEEHVRLYGATVSPERRAEVDSELSRLRRRVGRIDVRVEGVESAAVLVDGREVGRAPLRRPVSVNAGRRQVTVRAEGFSPVTREVDVQAGDQVSVVIALERGSGGETQPTVQPVPDPGTGTAPTPTTQRPGRGLWIGGWVTAGVAVAALGAALGLFLWNNSQYDTWETEDADIRTALTATTVEEDILARVDDNNALHETIEGASVATWVVMGVGAAAAATAVVLLVLGARRRSQAPAVALVPTPGGLTLSGGF